MPPHHQSLLLTTAIRLIGPTDLSSWTAQVVYLTLADSEASGRCTSHIRSHLVFLCLLVLVLLLPPFLRGQWLIVIFFYIISHVVGSDETFGGADPRGLTFTWWGCWGLCFWHKPAELAHSFYYVLVSYFCLYAPFNCISFHKLSRQLSAFSFCSSGLISALLVLCTVYLFMKICFSPDIIFCGSLGLKHELTDWLVVYAEFSTDCTGNSS